MSSNDRLDRRAALKGAGCMALSAAMPVGLPRAGALCATPSATLSDNLYLIASPEISPRLRQVRREYVEALETYTATGDPQAIEHLRLHARNKFGFALGLRARNEEESRLFREAGALLEELETKFPELPMSADMRARYGKLRAWAEQGGQFARLGSRTERSVAGSSAV